MDRIDLCRLSDWKMGEHYAKQQLKDCKISADSKRHRQHCCGCEPGRFGQLTKCVPQIGPKACQPKGCIDRNNALLHCCSTSEPYQRIPLGILGRHSASDVVFNAHLDMCFEFAFDFP